MNTLYMADLDGTLLNTSGELSHYTLVTLNALIERGLPFTVNTSRTPQSVMPVIKGLHLKLDAVLMNGSCFFDTEKKQINSLVLLQKPQAAAAISVCKSVGCEPFLFDFSAGDVNVLYSSAESAASKKFIAERKNYYREFLKTESNDCRAAYIVCADSIDKLNRLHARLKSVAGISCSLFYGDNDREGLLEIYAEDAGKKNGAERFMKQHGFNSLVTFGDNLNDIEMLKFSDRAIAVANAKPEAIAAANEIIESCNDDAVAKWLLLEWARRPELY